MSGVSEVGGANETTHDITSSSHVRAAIDREEEGLLGREGREGGREGGKEGGREGGREGRREEDTHDTHAIHTT